MSSPSMKAAEVLQLAYSFRAHAAEANDAIYHSMMLRAALELEECAETLWGRDGLQLVMLDDDESEDA